MEESGVMAHSQRARGLVYYVTGTASKLDVAIIRESVAMACLQPEMGLIDHATGRVNATFCGNREGGVVMGRVIQAAIVG